MKEFCLVHGESLGPAWPRHSLVCEASSHPGHPRGLWWLGSRTPFPGSSFYFWLPGNGVRGVRDPAVPAADLPALAMMSGGWEETASGHQEKVAVDVAALPCHCQGLSG